jgi:sugar transferase (PEP-CTERM/EpsH1 system associated)
MSSGFQEMAMRDQGPGEAAVMAGAANLAAAESVEKAASCSRALKVLHVVNNMGLGGTEKVVLKLAAKLTEGFEHQVCCVRRYDAAWVQTALRPEQLIALDLPPSRFAVFVPQLAKTIRSCKPDIVHSRNWGAIEAVFAARLAGVPVVVHSEHGYDVALEKTSLRQRWVRRLACSAADAFFTVSRELQDFHARQAGVPAERIRVLYNGVDTVNFAPQPDVRARIRAELGIAPDEFVVGAVGRMVPIKDYETLVRAAGVLAGANLRFKLMLVGDGRELPGVVGLAQSLPGMSARLLALGERDDIPELLSAMDVFAQTSLREGLSNTVLEAMSTGLPAVVTAVGGNPEVVEDGINGWLFQPGDVQGLSQLLLSLASDRNLCRRAGAAARLRVQEKFSNGTMLESYRALYMDLARKRKCM